MEKVKLPKEIANALDEIKKKYQYPIRVTMDLVYEDTQADTPEGLEIQSYVESDRSRRVELLARAVVNGYEVEETAEEKVKKLFDQAVNEEKKLGDHPNVVYWQGKQIGIEDALNALGIKIEGVNA